jgi:hypothetical protein
MDNTMQKIFEYCNNDPKTKGLIVYLKIVIDQIEFSYTNFKDIIKELAKRLYEGNICERDKISQVIKHLLIDKIREGKISAKWIEECLPKEYKRKYIIKSELNSLSSKRPKPKTITITNDSCEVLDNNIISTFQSDRDHSSQNENKLLTSFEKKDENDDEINEIKKKDNEIKELKEIIDKYEKFIVADQIFTENTVFAISKEKFQLLKDEMEKSKQKCHLKFDKNKVAIEIYSDS